MRGDAEDQGLLWDANVLCDDLLDDEGFLATLGRARACCFATRTSSRCTRRAVAAPRTRRRCSPRCCWPSCSMGCPTASRSGAAALTSRGRRRWGCPSTTEASPTPCLAEFRARLLRGDMVEFLNDTFLRVAKQAGVIGHRRAVDSTGIADSALTQDTVSLIRGPAPVPGTPRRGPPRAGWRRHLRPRP